MSKRRVLIVTATLALAAGLLWVVPVRQDLGWIDGVSGSRKRQTNWLFGFASRPVVEESPLELRLRRIGASWQPDWRNVQGTRRNLFGGVLAREHGPTPPIYDFPAKLQQLFCELSTDADVRAFHAVMTDGTDDDRQTAISRASSQVWAALLEGALSAPAED